MRRLTAEAPTHPRGGAGRNTVFAFLTQIGTAGFTAALTLYLVRALGPREFGIFALAVSIGGFVYLPSDFGIAGSASRFIGERRGDRGAIAAVMSDALRLKLAISGALSIVMIAVAGLVADAYGQPSLAWPIRWVAIAILGQGLVAFYRYAFTAQHEAHVGFRIVLSESAVETAATILLVVLLGGAAAAAAGRAAGYTAGSAVAVIVTLRHIGRPAFARARGLGVARRALAGYAGAVFLMDLMFTTSVATAPLLIGGFLGPKAVGLYQATARLLVLMQYPGISVGNGVAPGMVQGEGRKPNVRTFTSAFRYLIVFQCFLLAPVLVWAEPIVRLTLGPGYDRSVEILRILTPYVFMSGFNALAVGAITYLGEARRRIPIAAADVVVTVGLTAVLVPALGLNGAAIASDAAPLFYVPACLLIVRQATGMSLRPLLVGLSRGLLAAGAMAGVLALFGTGRLGPVEWIAGGILGTGAFLAVVIATGEVTVAQLRDLPRWFARRRRG